MTPVSIETSGNLVRLCIACDDRAALDDAIRRYLRDYPAEGYGTTVAAGPRYKDGRWLAQLWRASSCE